MDKKKHNFLITQIAKGVPLEKIDTSWGEGKEEKLFGAIRQSEAETEAYLEKHRL